MFRTWKLNNWKLFGNCKVWKLEIAFFALLLLFIFVAKNVDAAVLQKPPANLGLVGYWSFNEGTSTYALDYSGSGNKGTLTGMALNPSTPSSGWNPGKLGRALSFDGVNEYVDVANESKFDFERTNSFSVSAWAKRNSAGTYDAIVAKQGAAPTYTGWQLIFGPSSDAVVNDNAVYINMLNNDSTNNGIVVNSATSTITVGKWHHIVMVYDGSSLASGITIYIDGIAQTNTVLKDNLSATILNNTNLMIGINNGIDHPMDGSIDEVRIYNRALSAGEVAGLYNSGAVKFQVPNNKGLVGYWSFNEGTSTYALDYSGSGNKGTLTGMALNPSTPSSGWNPGKVGKALSFDGNDDYVKVNNSLTNGFSAMTVAFWENQTSGGASLSMIGKWNTNQQGWVIQHSSAGPDNIRFFVPTSLTDSSTVVNAPANTIKAGQGWHYIVVVFNGAGADNPSRVQIYRDGIQLVLSFGNPIPSSLQSSTANLNIGRIDIGQNFNGLIDEVRIYNRALSAGEVAGLYNSGAVKFQVPNNKGLVGYWSFNEGTSTYALDYSGNGNKGTLTNMALNPSTPSSGWNPGKLGKALSFDGSNDYVETNKPSSNFHSASVGTMVAWINPKGTSPTITNSFDGQLVVGTGATGGGVTGLLRGIISGADRIWAYNWDGNEDRVGIPYNVNEWIQVAWVHANGTLFAYKNGILVNSTASVDTTTGVQTIKLGGSNSTDVPVDFQGLIDEVRIYNRALSADEVKKLYESR